MFCLSPLAGETDDMGTDYRETDGQKVEEAATLDVNEETGSNIFLVQSENLQIYCRDTLFHPFPPFEKHSLLCH